MEDDVRYMFLVSTIGCVAVIALLALRITTNASFSLFSGVLIGFFCGGAFLIYQIFKPEGSVGEDRGRGNRASIPLLIMFSTFGIVLARIFGERLLQNWIDVLIGSITAFLIIISGTVSFVLWSHRGEQKTFSGRKLTIDKDSFNERIRRQKQEKIAWRDRLRRQRQEEIEWREKQRRR